MYAKLGLLASARQLFNEMTVRDVPAWNSVVAGHARCGDMEGASELFAAMPCRNVISWTAMISGYSQCGQYQQALDTFLEMERAKGVRPNEVTIASVLPACANLGALEIGQRIEVYSREKGYFGNMFVCNAILDMYSRCGSIDMAKRVFDEIGRKRDVCSWNSMIMGLAVHGKCNEALQLFQETLVSCSLVHIQWEYHLDIEYFHTDVTRENCILTLLVENVRTSSKSIPIHIKMCIESVAPAHF